MNIASASHHALERYRQHHPEASAEDLLLAAHVAVNIPQEIAFALTGRRPTMQDQDHGVHRLHVEGTGIFVVCPVYDNPLVHFIKTYLRLMSEEQQRMAIAWFLDPLDVLRSAFELGFHAARAANAPGLASQASQKHQQALLALAPRITLAAQRRVVAAPPPPAAPRPVPSPAPPPKTQQPPPGPQPPASEARPPNNGLRWTAEALGHNAWFAKCHTDYQPDVDLWPWLTEAGLNAVLAPVHAGKRGTANGGRLEPSAKAAAILEVRASDDIWVLRIISIPKVMRPSVLQQVRERPKSEPQRSSPQREVAKVIAAPLERPAERADPVEADAPPVTPAPRAAHDDPGPWFLSAAEATIMSWSPRGLRNATQIGFTIISPPWLSLMTPVPPHDVEPLARAAGWQLQPATVYAALRNDTVVLLLEGASPAQMVVARCGDLPLGYR